MIREIIRPQHTNITIDIPTEYIDRDIELILFPIEAKEKMKNSKKSKTKKSLRGIFSQYADKSKIALEDSAWQNHIIEKFKK